MLLALQNLRVVAKCYTRISTKRLSEIMELTPEVWFAPARHVATRASQRMRLPLQKTEAYVSRLVNSKMIFAKIDRLAGVVNFTAVKVRLAVPYSNKHCAWLNHSICGP